MMPLGMAVASPEVDIIGIRAWLAGVGLVTGLAGLVAFSIPTVMHIEDRQNEGDLSSSENIPTADSKTHAKAIEDLNGQYEEADGQVPLLESYGAALT